MKALRNLVMIITASASIISPRAVSAAEPTPPTVVSQDRNDAELLRDLRGVPDNVKTLVLGFDQTRDRYLRQQNSLLAKLRHATSDAERDQIRAQLQANRQDFLADLKTFRHDLRSDLKALSGKISNGELQRILDAAHDAATEGAHHRRGH